MDSASRVLIGSCSLIAKQRDLRINGKRVAQTPILLPSFSSKGLAPGSLKAVMQFAEGLISEEALVSAYDIHHGEIELPTFPSVLFVDSGGYEASDQLDFSDVGKRRHEPRKWNPELHTTTLDRLGSAIPTVFVSYDHRRPVSEQAQCARDLLAKYPRAGRELLIKPSSTKSRYVDIDAATAYAKALSDFDVVGFTETELGSSTFERMVAIARVRRALREQGSDIPIHIFGSLDPVSSPLYFVSGADVFDGLTWLRYSFKDGQTTYKHNYGMLHLSIRERDERVNARSATNNYYYLLNLRDEMLRYLGSGRGDFNCFRHHAEFFCNSYESLKQKVGE